MIIFSKEFLLIFVVLLGLSSCYREVVVYKDGVAPIHKPQIYKAPYRAPNSKFYKNPYAPNRGYYKNYDQDYYYVPNSKFYNPGASERGYYYDQDYDYVPSRDNSHIDSKL